MGPNRPERPEIEGATVPVGFAEISIALNDHLQRHGGWRLLASAGTHCADPRSDDTHRRATG